MASPFIDKIFTFTQPDGTQFKVRGSGDQHYAVFETLDGYTVVKDPDTGFYKIAQASNDGSMLEPVTGSQGNMDSTRASAIQPNVRINREAARAQGMEGALRVSGRRCDQRREQRKSLARAARTLNGPVFAPPQRETVGDFIGLCLLIDFSDEPGTISRGEVEKFCNEPGYSGFGNNGSVADYFHDNSIGRCRYTNVVVEYYRAQHPKTYYTDPNIPQGTRARQLIVEALTHLQDNNFDFTALTADSGGFVYAMNVYYAGEVVNNWAEGLWPHAWSLATPVLLTSGKSAFDYQFTDMSQELTLGTFCHENGHMLCDYPDLYDYGRESGGVGSFCLMCAGNINEKNPTHISAYLKRLSGWAKSVTSIQPNQHISLAAGENEFALLSKDSGEYFIVENRAKSGRDLSLPDEGLAIWHVDEDGNNSNEQMTSSQHYELSLEQADGEFSLERSAQLGDATDLFGTGNKRFADSTLPNSKWWDGTASNLDLSAITDPGSSMSFRTSVNEDSTTIKGESSPALEIPDNNSAGIIDIISLTQDASIASVELTLDIAHTYRGDLRVTLLPPWGNGIVLHQRHQGGRADNIQSSYDESDIQDLATLKGHSTQGDWQLQIQDLAAADTGTLNHWTLEFASLAPPQSPVLLEEAPGIQIPDDDPAGIQRSLASNSPGTVGSVEVFVDINHTWIGDLTISIQSPDGTTVILHDETGDSADDIVKTYTTSSTSALDNFSGQSISGDWQLHVSDNAGQDVGKLNSWKLVIHPVV